MENKNIKKQILCLIDNLGSGGAQRQLTTLAILWQKQGYNVKFLVYGTADFFKSVLDKEQIKIDRIDSKNYLDRIIKVRKYLRNGNQDVVVSFLDTPNFLACISKIGGAKWKLIISERSCLESNFTSKRALLTKWVVRFADKIICNSYQASLLWKKFYPKYENKIDVIYNAVTLNLDENIVYTPKINGKLKMVVASSFQPLKNVLGLINAFSFLSKEEQKKIEVYWYGSNNDGINFNQNYINANRLINDMGLKDIVHLEDATSNIHSIMYNCDIVGLFSKYEGLPNVICEAMMMGKPIIMTKVSDYKSFMSNKNGALCGSDTPKDICSSLRKIINLSVDELESMGENSKAIAYKLFSADVIICKWNDIL